MPPWTSRRVAALCNTLCLALLLLASGTCAQGEIFEDGEGFITGAAPAEATSAPFTRLPPAGQDDVTDGQMTSNVQSISPTAPIGTVMEPASSNPGISTIPESETSPQTTALEGNSSVAVTSPGLLSNVTSTVTSANPTTLVVTAVNRTTTVAVVHSSAVAAYSVSASTHTAAAVPSDPGSQSTRTVTQSSTRSTPAPTTPAPTFTPAAPTPSATPKTPAPTVTAPASMPPAPTNSSTISTSPAPTSISPASTSSAPTSIAPAATSSAPTTSATPTSLAPTTLVLSTTPVAAQNHTPNTLSSAPSNYSLTASPISYTSPIPLQDNASLPTSSIVTSQWIGSPGTTPNSSSASTPPETATSPSSPAALVAATVVSSVAILAVAAAGIVAMSKRQQLSKFAIGTKAATGAQMQFDNFAADKRGSAGSLPPANSALPSRPVADIKVQGTESNFYIAPVDSASSFSAVPSFYSRNDQTRMALNSIASNEDEYSLYSGAGRFSRPSLSAISMFEEDEYSMYSRRPSVASVFLPGNSAAPFTPDGMGMDSTDTAEYDHEDVYSLYASSRSLGGQQASLPVQRPQSQTSKLRGNIRKLSVVANDLAVLEQEEHWPGGDQQTGCATHCSVSTTRSSVDFGQRSGSRCYSPEAAEPIYGLPSDDEDEPADTGTAIKSVKSPPKGLATRRPLVPLYRASSKPRGSLPPPPPHPATGVGMPTDCVRPVPSIDRPGSHRLPEATVSRHDVQAVPLPELTGDFTYAAKLETSASSHAPGAPTFSDELVDEDDYSMYNAVSTEVRHAGRHDTASWAWGCHQESDSRAAKEVRPGVSNKLKRRMSDLGKTMGLTASKSTFRSYADNSSPRRSCTGETFTKYVNSADTGLEEIYELAPGGLPDQEEDTYGTI